MMDGDGSPRGTKRQRVDQEVGSSDEDYPDDEVIQSEEENEGEEEEYENCEDEEEEDENGHEEEEEAEKAEDEDEEEVNEIPQPISHAQQFWNPIFDPLYNPSFNPIDPFNPDSYKIGLKLLGSSFNAPIGSTGTFGTQAGQFTTNGYPQNQGYFSTPSIGGYMDHQQGFGQSPQNQKYSNRQTAGPIFNAFGREMYPLPPMGFHQQHGSNLQGNDFQSQGNNSQASDFEASDFQADNVHNQSTELQGNESSQLGPQQPAMRARAATRRYGAPAGHVDASDFGSSSNNLPVEPRPEIQVGSVDQSYINRLLGIDGVDPNTARSSDYVKYRERVTRFLDRGKKFSYLKVDAETNGEGTQEGNKKSNQTGNKKKNDENGVQKKNDKVDAKTMLMMKRRSEKMLVVKELPDVKVTRKKKRIKASMTQKERDEVERHNHEVSEEQSKVKLRKNNISASRGREKRRNRTFLFSEGLYRAQAERNYWKARAYSLGASSNEWHNMPALQKKDMVADFRFNILEPLDDPRIEGKGDSEEQEAFYEGSDYDHDSDDDAGHVDDEGNGLE